jgi:hypothetical protein
LCNISVRKIKHNLFFRLNPAGDLIPLPLRSHQRSVLVTGCVSYDYPRDIHRVCGPNNIDQYLTVLQSVAATGRTIVHSRNPVHSSPRVKAWISANNMSSILWPAECVDIMSMTSIWCQFIFEFNKSTPVFGNSDQLWAEIETCWETFMQNEFHVMSSTVGYLWADLLNI